MIHGTLTDFIDQLYYGQELWFLYKGEKYFLQGWTEDENNTMVLSLVDGKPFTGYIWEDCETSMIACGEHFLKAPIWSGRTFLEIENDVEWVDD